MPRALIAVSKGFTSLRYVERCLEDLQEFTKIDEVDVVDWGDAFLDPMQNQRNWRWRWIKHPSNLRSDAKRYLAGIDLLVVFWDGDSMSQLIFESRMQNIRTRVFPIEVSKVVNRDKGEPYDVYIGRGTQWGNPYHVGQGPGRHSRDEAIELYREYFASQILTDPRKHKALIALRGYRLACHCKPLPCHGDVLCEYLNGLDPEIERTPLQAALPLQSNGP